TPPTGVRWYWQGKNSNGSSTSLGYGSSFTVNQGSGTYYIRARSTNSGTWSPASASVYVGIVSFLPGSIGSNQTICYSGDPATLSNSASASGGSGGYSYQWQYSSNGSSGWANISGATSSSYNPPSGLTSSRWYRRRVISCNQTKYTDPVKVTVRPQLLVGSIGGSKTICYGSNAGTLSNASSPSGGNGSYTYLWQYSANGSSGWTNISGSTLASYTPPAGLTASRWYRRGVTSCGQTKHSSPVKVTVHQSLSLPTGSTSFTRCGDGTLTLSQTLATGANTLRWYAASSGGSYLHQGSSYTTPSLSNNTTYYVSSYN
ncbi:immunoglobulin domain-containing protein, partial [Poritiphilus flavus]|nr:hypothetical protein [Poritiphilus flavus]